MAHGSDKFDWQDNYVVKSMAWYKNTSTQAVDNVTAKGINSSHPGQNGRHFTNDTFRYIFVNEKFCILIKISLKFVPMGPIDNNQALV